MHPSKKTTPCINMYRYIKKTLTSINVMHKQINRTQWKTTHHNTLNKKLSIQSHDTYILKEAPTSCRPLTFLPVVDIVVPILNNKSPLSQGYESTREMVRSQIPLRYDNTQQKNTRPKAPSPSIVSLRTSHSP